MRSGGAWHSTFLCAVSAVLFGGCGAPAPPQPEGVWLLPPELREVSGITALDGRTVACVQDELGIVFLYDLERRVIAGQLPFGPRGDYEAITRAGDDWWVLRSDGLLLHLRWTGSSLVLQGEHPLPLPYADFEGLCLDPAHDRLLVAPKDRPRGDKEQRDLRRVYAFDLRTRELLAEPVLQLDLVDLAAQAEQLGTPLPVRETAKGKERIALKLLCSEIAVDPSRDEILLLSGVDRALVRVDRGGRLRAVQFFPADELPQPEGLAFLPDGRLLIASEGPDGPGRLRLLQPPPEGAAAGGTTAR